MAEYEERELSYPKKPQERKPMLMPQLNHEKFIRACRGAGLKHIAKLLGIDPNTVTKKLKNPTNNLSVREFLQICEMLEEPPERFFIGTHIESPYQKGDLT